MVKVIMTIIIIINHNNNNNNLFYLSQTNNPSWTYTMLPRDNNNFWAQQSKRRKIIFLNIFFRLAILIFKQILDLGNFHIIDIYLYVVTESFWSE